MHTNVKKDQLEKRLIAVAFMPGNQGSFITHLLNLSPEVDKHRLADGNFSDGTAHWGNEQWMPHCHHWDHAKLINEEYFYTNIPDQTLDTLNNSNGLMPFRCHPAVARAVQILLPNLKIIHITHPDPYHAYRLYWEKLIVGFDQEQAWYVDSYYRTTGTKPRYLTPAIKRQLLLGWFDHYQDTAINAAYELNLVDFWQDPWGKYLSLTRHFGLTKLPQRDFYDLVDQYRSRQWTRF